MFYYFFTDIIIAKSIFMKIYKMYINHKIFKIYFEEEILRNKDFTLNSRNAKDVHSIIS